MILNFFQVSKLVRPCHTDSTIYYSHAHLKLPFSAKEVAAVVTAAGAQGRRVRVVGAGHSFSEVARPDDILISMANFKVNCTVLHINE